MASLNAICGSVRIFSSKADGLRYFGATANRMDASYYYNSDNYGKLAGYRCWNKDGDQFYFAVYPQLRRKYGMNWD